MYIYTTTDNKATLISQQFNYDQIITQETYPARIDQPKPHKDVFWQGYGVTPQSGLHRFLFFRR